jgi:hypothetical protein
LRDWGGVPQKTLARSAQCPFANFVENSSSSSTLALRLQPQRKSIGRER